MAPRHCLAKTRYSKRTNGDFHCSSVRFQALRFGRAETFRKLVGALIPSSRKKLPIIITTPTPAPAAALIHPCREQRPTRRKTRTAGAARLIVLWIPKLNPPAAPAENRYQVWPERCHS